MNNIRNRASLLLIEAPASFPRLSLILKGIQILYIFSVKRTIHALEYECLESWIKNTLEEQVV